MSNPVEVLNFLPATPDVSSSTAMSVDVRSLSAIRRVVVLVSFAGLTFVEAAYNGRPATNGAAGFTENYSASLFETITDGLYFRYRFTLRPSVGAWIASPSIQVVAVNADGEEA